LAEQAFEFGVFQIFSTLVETFLTVFAGFDQVVEQRDSVFVVHVQIPLLRLGLQVKAVRFKSAVYADRSEKWSGRCRQRFR
jgi:hypothetical protein